MVRLQFPNSDVGDVLRLYEQLTGKKLVMDNFVQGKVSIFIAKEVPREEAIKIIEMNLLLNGYSLIPAEDTDIVKVIGTGKNPRTTGVPIVSDETEIPDGDHVISYRAISFPAAALHVVSGAAKGRCDSGNGELKCDSDPDPHH